MRDLRPICHVRSLLAELKACSKGKDLQWGRNIHEKAIKSGNASDIHVLTALVKAYSKCGSMVEARSVFESIQNPDVVSWTVLLLGYLEKGQGIVALELFSRMKASGCAPDSVTYVAAVKACTSLLGSCRKEEVLDRGRKIHSDISLHLNLYVQNTLIDMYSKCGSMVDAQFVFDNIQKPDVVSWNALLLGYTDNGQGNVALDLFPRMKPLGCTPDPLTYVSCFKACASLALNGDREVLEKARKIHMQVGCHLDPRVQSSLIDMYAKWGSMVEAYNVFKYINNPHVVSWNALLLGYVDNGEASSALELFSMMKVHPDSVTYVAAIKACTSLATNESGNAKKLFLNRGRRIHLQIGFHMNSYVKTTLIDMYAKCDSMFEAHKAFDSIPKPDLATWNALLLGYAENGNGYVALDLFCRMKATGCIPDYVTYVAAIKACTSLAVDGNESEGLQRGRRIHLQISCNLTQSLESALILMYGKCGSMIEAHRVFDSACEPNVVSWTSLISGYAENSDGHFALDLFSKMKFRGYVPDSHTYVAALKACASLGADSLERGREIHSEIAQNLDHFLQSALIGMYGRCGSMSDARCVFDSMNNPDVVSWNALLLGYADNGQGNVSLEMFLKLKTSGCVPSSATYTAVLKACGLVGALSFGRKLHSEMREFNAALVTSLVDFYGKCGSMPDAHEVFDLHSRRREVTTCTALLAGYARFGQATLVFNLFDAMKDEGLQPNSITFGCLLQCCSHAGFVEQAKDYFEIMRTRYSISPTVLHYNCMVDVLGRANELNEAIALIRTIPCSPDVVTWVTLLGASRKWKNLEIGRLAFQVVSVMDKRSSSAYILMANIYGSNGMLEEQKRVLEMRATF